MHNENRFLDTFRGHNIRPIRNPIIEVNSRKWCICINNQYKGFGVGISDSTNTGRNVGFSCLLICNKSYYKFQVCNDLHKFARVQTSSAHMANYVANVVMAAKPYVANLLQTRCKLIILQRVCTRANLMQTPNLHRICIFVNL